MEPGASKPKPGGDPTAPMDDAEVEKTLSSLESITSTLVKEVGTPPNRAAMAEARATATAEPPPPAATDTALATAQDSATEPPTAPTPADQAQPATAEPNTEPAVSAEPGTIAAPTQALPEPATPADTEPVTNAAEPNTEPASSAEAASVTTPVEPKIEPAASADTEVEQEINQAIRQLQGGQPAPAAAATAPPAETAAAASVLRRVLGSLTRAAGAILSPLALLVLLLDLPFRRTPMALKHLLGYIAVGTALMAAALWYYIIAVRPH